ncbi:hypothetical protein Q8G53_28560, partial [Klebsiella pneumoniae]
MTVQWFCPFFSFDWFFEAELTDWGLSKWNSKISIHDFVVMSINISDHRTTRGIQHFQAGFRLQMGQK